MLSDPLLQYDASTGCHEIVLVNGDPVESDDMAYACLSVLLEDPWLMDEVGRIGNILDALAETTTRTTPSQTRAAINDRLGLLVKTGDLVSATASQVDLKDLLSGGRGILAEAQIVKPGAKPVPLPLRLRGT